MAGLVVTGNFTGHRNRNFKYLSSELIDSVVCARVQMPLIEVVASSTMCAAINYPHFSLPLTSTAPATTARTLPHFKMFFMLLVLKAFTQSAITLALKHPKLLLFHAAAQKDAPHTPNTPYTLNRLCIPN